MKPSRLLTSGGVRRSTVRGMSKITEAALMGGAAAAAIAATVGVAAPAQAYVDEAFLICPSGSSGVDTSVTSCAFADNVRYSYLTQSGQVVTAYSPVTGQHYTMQCAEGFRAYLNNGTTVRSARCVGGNNAVVVIW